MNKEARPKTWLDQDGREIPSRLITPYDKQRQRHAATLLKRAKRLSVEMALVKHEMSKALQEVQDRFCADKQTEPTPAFSFSSYDKGIKVERTRNVQVKFDENLLNACKQKFDEYLTGLSNDDTALLVNIVKDAFTQVKGKPDSNKLLQLLNYRAKVTHPIFQEALDLLDESVGKGNSKLYFKVSELQQDGSYKQVNLDFASL